MRGDTRREKSFASDQDIRRRQWDAKQVELRPGETPEDRGAFLMAARRMGQHVVWCHAPDGTISPLLMPHVPNPSSASDPVTGKAVTSPAQRQLEDEWESRCQDMHRQQRIDYEEWAESEDVVKEIRGFSKIGHDIKDPYHPKNAGKDFEAMAYHDLPEEERQRDHKSTLRRGD